MLSCKVRPSGSKRPAKVIGSGGIGGACGEGGIGGEGEYDGICWNGIDAGGRDREPS